MNIKTDSRNVKPGDTFVALRGIKHDGHDFINEAITKGATLIIAEEGNYEVDTLLVSDTHDYLVNYLKNTYNDILKEIKLIGITGTNGKTTSCYMIHSALNKLGIKCGYIGTIGFFIDKKIKDLNNTTPDILELYEMILYCYECHCTYIVMEVSSQSLAMHRVDGLKFDYAIFTNLTQDHLDYHENMNNYCLAKKQLFKMLTNDGIAIINSDDQYSEYFLLNQNKNITYGFSNSDYKINNYKVNHNGISFTLNNQIYDTNIFGKYNVYNITVMIVILNLLGFVYDDLKKIVFDCLTPPGRMERIRYDDKAIIIDYAHTPDAVENVILTTKEFCKGKIYTIIGCGGDRDKTKRSKMGVIATNLSDYVIFTSDNPRNEQPEKIIDDMLQDVDKKNYIIEINRKEAIKKGIQRLSKNDILLILGKGHETYQIIGDKKLFFSDRNVVLEYFRR